MQAPKQFVDIMNKNDNFTEIKLIIWGMGAEKSRSKTEIS